jgi:hypothetical protein
MRRKSSCSGCQKNFQRSCRCAAQRKLRARAAPIGLHFASRRKISILCTPLPRPTKVDLPRSGNNLLITAGWAGRTRRKLAAFSEMPNFMAPQITQIHPLGSLVKLASIVLIASRDFVPRRIFAVARASEIEQRARLPSAEIHMATNAGQLPRSSVRSKVRVDSANARW